MANLVELARIECETLLSAALTAAISDGLIPRDCGLSGSVSPSKGEGNGDFAANHAMAMAKAAKMNPKTLAEILCSKLELENSFFIAAAVAGPGFINFSLSDNWYSGVLAAIQSSGSEYGQINAGNGEKVMVEFVSANPTGPMTIGNARGGVLGDSLASVLTWSGYSVHREFYVNDEGNQIDLFGRSIETRYLHLIQGEDSIEFPENGYKGEDIRDLAHQLYNRDGEVYLDMEPDLRREKMVEFALPINIELMRRHLERYRISFDRWFHESELIKSGYVDETMDVLTAAGYTYEKDGALWLANTQFGADKDEVLRRSNGFYTYYASDIAYHRDKFLRRGFDRVIDVWGADHHGHSLRFKATMTAEALGMSDKQLDFLITQMVRLVREGETVKVSKRTGRALTLNDLLDEIGVDACRFFFCAKPDTHLEFDLDLAIRQDSENPVYYVQYAHARICSILRNLEAEGITLPDNFNAALLSTDKERELISQLAQFPEEIRLAAREYDPSRICRYLIELAGHFHRFYTACRIKGEEDSLLKSRLFLVGCVQTVIKSALGIIGVTAPERM